MTPDEEESKTWQEFDVKIETEPEVKEPKDETPAEIKSQPTLETPAKLDHPNENRMILDVDKFEPIESDEDDVLCDRLDIKTEIEDAEDKSMDTDTYKQEPISEDSKSQDNVDTQSSVDDVKPPLTANEDFDLDDSQSQSNAEQLTKSDVSLLENVLPKNEIEDIQQKLHSFHSENLMILQTRNKKRASRATTPTSDEVSPTQSTTTVALKEVASTEFATTTTATSTANRKFSIDDREFKSEATIKAPVSEDESAYGQYLIF